MDLHIDGKSVAIGLVAGLLVNTCTGNALQNYFNGVSNAARRETTQFVNGILAPSSPSAAPAARVDSVPATSASAAPAPLGK